MRINVVRRSGISRALAGVGTAMIALPLIMVAAYAAVILAAVAIVVIVVTVVRHLLTPAAVPVATVRRADDPAVAAHLAAVRAATR